ncbi:MAG: tryptophan 7-halogenase [Candidatus Andeanibacterium colombiense]|uniref:Tryptophan 7-halogenase n=1 Tax=Candidatus Andeanibacterium colombiense TaxID=3121345 RepID=A0AAJ5X691_9SPHN|nr:MAG: tryptophan 7-halogenase [Sphingomonadaceae bacterium]
MTDIAIGEQLPADPREERIRSVVVVGGGSSGWMTAAYLVTALSRDIRVTLVESETIGIVGVGEATIPPIREFNRFLRLDERAFMQATQGSIKLGIDFHNWGRRGDRYMHQFGRAGRELDAVVQLHHWWLAGRLAPGGEDYPAFEDMFPATAMGRAERFVPPAKDADWRTGQYSYAYHFDAYLYGQYLRKVAEARGATRIEGLIAGAERDGATGHVGALVLKDGRRLEADLFVDCSGFRSILLGGEFAEPFDDWSEWLPNDSAIATTSAREPERIVPYTRAIALEVGWQWRIPLQHRIGNGHVYASAFSSDEDAERRLRATLDTPIIRDPFQLRFKAGRRRRSWVGNVVSVGLASGFLEPLESTSIHLVQASIERLVQHFPTRRMDRVLRDRFNEQTRLEWERVRDFIIAHYHLTERDDSPFWNHVRTMTVPDSLAAVLECWRERGILAVEGNHLFQLASWSAVLLGQRCLPRGVHALTDRASPTYAAAEIRKIAAEVKASVAAVPRHDEFLARYAPAPPEG